MKNILENIVFIIIIYIIETMSRLIGEEKENVFSKKG